MSNKLIEATLRLSSKLGSMKAFSTLGANLAKVDAQARAFNRTQTALAAGHRELNATLMRYAAPAALAAAGAASVKAFATVERRMERIGITADASAKQTTAALDAVRQIADDLKVPVDSVVEGLEGLVVSGKSLDEALAFLPSVAAAAHAGDAAFGDMATTADAVGASFGIAAGRMKSAFDLLVEGAAAGKFELKDMASELPSLAPAFAALGYDGEEGLKRLISALQTVRLETGTSSEAATSFMDVISKMESETMKNNFARFGVDIRKEMAAARDAGKYTLETFINLSTEAVNGDLSKLPQLFTDKQMLIGMRALINNTEEFAGFMDRLGQSAGAANRAVARLANDAQADLDRLGNSWAKLKQSIGSGIVKAGAVDAMTGLASSVDYATAVNAGLEKKGVSGFLNRSAWGVMNDRVAKDSMAWVGGFKSDDQRRALAGYAAYAESRAAAGAAPEGVTPRLPADRTGLPLAGPVPAARPVSAAASDIDVEIARQKAARPYQPGPAARFAPGATPRDAERDSMAALRSDPNGVADAIDMALAQGGEKAASRIADGAQESGQKFGAAATERLQAEAVSAGTAFGRAAADAFNRGARAPTPQRVPGTAASGSSTGLSMPEAGN